MQTLKHLGPSAGRETVNQSMCVNVTYPFTVYKWGSFVKAGLTRNRVRALEGLGNTLGS